MGIDHRRQDIAMADKVLDRSDAVSRLQRVFGEGTPNGRPDLAASATGSRPINTPNGPSLLPALRSRRKLQPILRRHFPQLLDQLIGNRRRSRLAVRHGRKDLPEVPLHTRRHERHQLNGRAAAQVLESVNGPAGNEDEVTSLGLIGRIAEEDLQAAAHDIERLVLPAVDVRRRASARRHDGLELEEGVVRLLARGQEVVEIPRPPDRRSGSVRPENRLHGVPRDRGLVSRRHRRLGRGFRFLRGLLFRTG